MNVARMMLRMLRRNLIQSMGGLRRNKTFYYGLFIVLFILVFSFKQAKAGEYEYKGVFPIQTLMLEFCDDCWLELPPDFLAGSMVLNVVTDSHDRLFKAMQKSAAGQGWNLTRNGNILKAEPIQNIGSLVYISCMDNQPHNVEKYLYSASLKADSIQCAKRDSALFAERSRADSLAQEEKRIKDSIAAIPPIDFSSYELRYYSYSKSFTDKLGFEWSEIWATGNLHNRFKVLDGWRMFATENNDTTYNERKLAFTLDSTMAIDWGSEEQAIVKTYQNDGVVTQDYEWRKYGLIVKIIRDGRRVKMEYTFRDKDNSVSVLQGSVVGTDRDTLSLFGDYMAKREINHGLPWLSKIPVLNWFVATQQVINDLKAFELYLVPITREMKDEYGRTAKDGTGKDTTGTDTLLFPSP